MQAEMMLREPSDLIHVVKDEARTTSILVAEIFGKQHKNVIRDIEKLECSEEFNRLNFEPVEYIDVKGEARKMVEMTKNGFTFLAMGFTGKKAAEFKERYIEAFDRMEDLIRERIAAQDKLPAYIRQLLAEDRISRLALKPDGTTTVTIKKPSPQKEASVKDLRAKALAIIKKIGSPSAREVQNYLKKTIDVTREVLDLLAQEGIIGKREVSGVRGPSTTRYFLQ